MIYLDEQTTAALITHELAYTAVQVVFPAEQEQQSSIFPVFNISGPIADSMLFPKSARSNNSLDWKMGSH